jgi:hypothetical protein
LCKSVQPLALHKYFIVTQACRNGFLGFFFFPPSSKIPPTHFIVRPCEPKKSIVAHGFSWAFFFTASRRKSIPNKYG